MSEDGRVEVRELDDVRDLAEAARLLARIWGSEPQDVMPVNLMKALAHSHNYVAGAWEGGQMVGASVGWVWGPERPGALHSHITGVDPTAQRGGVGLALKTHQAAWARRHDLRTVTWTFDPMVRSNGQFNLMKLGARAVSYHPDFYGEMRDGINAGELSDRCMVEWEVAAERPAPSGRPPSPTVLLSEGADGQPELSDFPGGMTGALLCQVPADAMALRRARPEAARQWRLAVRQTMGEAMAAGYAATGMTPDGYYVLERATPERATPARATPARTAP